MSWNFITWTTVFLKQGVVYRGFLMTQKDQKKKDAIKYLLEIFQQAGNINDGRVGNVWRLRAAVTAEIFEVVQQEMQLRLDYHTYPRAVSCVTASTFFRVGFRSTTRLMLQLIMHARRSQTQCCSSCMMMKLIWEKICSLMKLFFSLGQLHQ